MGLLGRAGEIIRAKFSALLNRAENPQETLDYSYEKQLESLQNVKRGVADVVTAKKRLELQTSQLEQNVVTLDTQARQALAAGREDLARQALERKSGIQQQLQDLDTQVKGLQDQQEKLVASEKQLSARIEQFRSQKEVIKAQYSAAEAQVKIGEAASGIGEHMADVGLSIQRATCGITSGSYQPSSKVATSLRSRDMVVPDSPVCSRAHRACRSRCSL